MVHLFSSNKEKNLNQMTEKKVIELLLSSYLKNELDQRETEFIESWISSSEENKRGFDRVRRISAEQSIHFPDHEVQKARERIKTIMLGRLISKRKRSNQLTGVFSILIIVTSSLAFYFAHQSPTNIPSNEYANQFSVKTGKGEYSECTLPDSTHIWLNANSEICYQLKDNGKLRSVEIKGEAFFDVAKMKKIPFEVSNGIIRVKVFGTKFDFKGYDSSIQVTLEEGSLGIYDLKENELARLIPGNQAVVNQAGTLVSLEQVDPKAFSGWKTGNFEFKDVSLEIIANYLTGIYGVSFKFNNESLKDERFRCVINRNRSILQVLELLKETSGIDYEIDGTEVIFK